MACCCNDTSAQGGPRVVLKDVEPSAGSEHSQVEIRHASWAGEALQASGNCQLSAPRWGGTLTVLAALVRLGVKVKGVNELQRQAPAENLDVNTWMLSLFSKFAKRCHDAVADIFFGLLALRRPGSSRRRDRCTVYLFEGLLVVSKLV